MTPRFPLLHPAVHAEDMEAVRSHPEQEIPTAVVGTRIDSALQAHVEPPPAPPRLPGGHAPLVVVPVVLVALGALLLLLVWARRIGHPAGPGRGTPPPPGSKARWSGGRLSQRGGGSGTATAARGATAQLRAPRDPVVLPEHVSLRLARLGIRSPMDREPGSSEDSAGEADAGLGKSCGKKQPSGARGCSSLEVWVSD